VTKRDPDQLVRDVGRRIGELRRTAGLTQERLAERLGVSVQWANRVEVGENLTLHSLAKLADALDVEVAELFEPPSEDPAEPRRVGRPRGGAS
jgi:transcriptional regulator with XRE-family HTH domain